MYNVNIIADTLFNKIRATTYELEYPRYIHAEVMTHRLFSRNAASSRAIPIEKMIEQATHNTVMPIWTANQSGMQGEVIKHGRTIQRANELMLNGLSAMCAVAEGLEKLGIHKQNANRYLEPFQNIKVVLTATEFENFFNLRYHKDAQPEIQQLAMQMFAEYHRSIPRKATGNNVNNDSVNAWHLPYADGITDLETAQKVSASCCAQVSYRKNDASEEKAEIVYDRLVGGEPLHASPFEHQCTWGSETSKGNLHGLTQYRQSIEAA